MGGSSDRTRRGAGDAGTSRDAGRFSVVVVHRNGAETLLRTLTALFDAVEPARDVVYLVDNGSSDDSLLRARDAYPALEVIENGCNRGYAGAINQAVPRSRSEFVLVLNNDAIVPPSLPDRFEALFRAWPRAAVIGPLLIDRDGAAQRCFGVEPTAAGEVGLRRAERRRPKLPDDEVAPVDWISGACMAVRRAAIERAGSIDDGFFFYFEDVEWCIRLRRAGWQALLDQRTRVVHEMGTSTRPVRRGAQIEALRSRLRFYRTVFPPAVAAMLSVWRLARLAVNTLSHVVLAALTLGLLTAPRAKALDYGYQLAWVVFGMPRRWGLPDKCPRRERAGADST